MRRWAPTLVLFVFGCGCTVRNDMSGVDAVAWGVVGTHPFAEKAPALQPSSGASISCQPAGTDTNDNSMDFKKTSPATPKAG